MIAEDMNTMLIFSVYDSKYERFNLPMFFPDIKTACVECERSIKGAYDENPSIVNYLEDIKIKLIGQLDLKTGKMFNVNEEDSFEINPVDYVRSKDINTKLDEKIKSLDKYENSFESLN